MGATEARGSELLTTQEAAAMLGIARKTLYEWRKMGAISPIAGNPIKQKQPRYYRRRDVERLIQQRLSAMQQLRAS